MGNKDLKIDFVLLWVDGNDSEWRKSFLEHLPESKQSDDVRDVRYRDWGLLPYWFRGVEQFAPWVNKIHFITCGHYPEWLNLAHPKLHFVRHEDYIPSEYLPTFNSNPIELHLHRLDSLSEHFVLFNDDMFIIDKVDSKRFFHNGLPCDMATFDIVASTCIANNFAHTVLNNVTAINQQFKQRNVLRKNWSKWFRVEYGSYLLRTLALLPWPYFVGFRDPHLPNAYLKSTLNTVWSAYGELLADTSTHKFRTQYDYNHWLFRYWQLATGQFNPINVYRSSVYYRINERTLPQIEQVILRQKKQILVLNDVEQNVRIPFEECRQRILSVFQQILPEKSSFEK
ncbi:Stealth CR1 domain-containing protein [Bacteroides sp. An51A]|uniref:Stealth CR1 domain-containing protein n=1 Tax=Bacteroides sp. An51A TaxID=1965640 RepID=UPI000B39FFCE|nr:Stealth CR1 domain-containing protein [Bacteroides sp. An51A]OUN81862.1 hypothetical protein B5G04_04430 [Bacteroides sp. An51A]